MVDSRVPLRRAALLCAGLLLLGCADAQPGPGRDAGNGSDVENPDVGPEDAAGSDLDTGGGDGDTPAQPDLQQSDADANGGDDANGSTDLPAEDLEPDLPPPVCPFDGTPAMFPDTYLDDEGSPRQVLLIVESIDFVNDIVVIRNVSNETGAPVTIDFNTDWRAYTNGANQFHLGSAHNLAPGARLRIHTSDGGVVDADDMWLNSNPMRLDACGGEFVIVHSQDGTEFTNHPGYIEAYVVWGNRFVAGSTATHNDEALEAEAWSLRFSEGGFATPTCWEEGESWCSSFTDGPCETTDRGLLATGDVTDPFGWTRIESAGDAAACFY